MSCTAALYTVNNGGYVVDAGSMVSLGGAVHGINRNMITAENGAIKISARGEYKICINMTVAAVAEGDVGFIALRNNVPITGALATETAAGAGDFVNLGATFFVKHNCCDDPTVIIAEITEGNVNVVNVAATVEKL